MKIRKMRNSLVKPGSNRRLEESAIHKFKKKKELKKRLLSDAQSTMELNVCQGESFGTRDEGHGVNTALFVGSELRSCVKVTVNALASPSQIARTDCVDVKKKH